MSKLAVFSFGNHEIRTATDEHGEVWFVANDVCAALGLKNTRHTLAKHVDEDDVAKRGTTDNLGREQQTNYINERGVLNLLIKSNRTPQKLLDEVISRVKGAKEVIAALEDFEIPENLPTMYVYAIRNNHTGRIKLGISQNPERRLKELQIGNDCELELVAFRKAENRFKDEKALHRENAPYCVRSEWFDDGINFGDSEILASAAPRPGQGRTTTVTSREDLLKKLESELDKELASRPL